jgi:hypothetical protein
MVLRGGIASTGKEFRGILGIGLVRWREIGRGQIILFPRMDEVCSTWLTMSPILFVEERDEAH